MLDQAYQDKLEGLITPEYWAAKSGEWRSEQKTILAQIQRHQEANKGYFEQGVRILELAEKAYSLFVGQKAEEKRKLLNIVLSNCTLTAGNLSPTWRKPFDLIAQGIQTEKWLPGQDSNLQPFG